MAAAALCAPALGGAAELFSNFNTCTVSNLTPGHFGYPPTIVSLQFPSHVTGLATYHWNNGRGAAPGPQGTITLAPLIVPTGTGTYVQLSQDMFPAQGQPGGNGNVANATWVASLDLVLPPGTYALADSSPGTWSENKPSQCPAGTQSSEGLGFAKVFGTSEQPTRLFSNFNTGAVVNGPLAATVFTLPTPAYFSEILTYHWNNGQGQTPGTITLNAMGRTMTFPAYGLPGGNGNVPNATWVAYMGLVLPAGTYTITDSDPATQAQNAASGQVGFAMVNGVALSPQVTVPSPPAPPAPGPAIPAPCDATSGAFIQLDQPGCAGPAGTLLAFTVLRPLAAPLPGVVFRPPARPNMCRVQTGNIPNLYQDILLTGAGAGGLMPPSGMSMTVGSTYTTTAPNLCPWTGAGHWTWEIDALGGLGFIDCFTLQCP
jgi:hypothetical protein